MFSTCKINKKWSIIFLYLIFIQQQIREIETKSLNKMSGQEAEEGEETHEIGTILFEDHGFTKRCFTQNDIALLATRLKLQSLIPSKDAFLEDDESIETKIRYFYTINDVISKLGYHETKELINKAFYDMLGGYLKHFLLPVAKYSFYAGNVTFITANNLFELYERCKELLNTNGNSWKEPITDFSGFSFKIEQIILPKTVEKDEDQMKACVNLMLNQDDTDNDEDMLVALPKIEVEETEDLSTIWLPFKRKHIFNLHSRTSAFILFRYFIQVSKCYNYQGAQQTIFNQKLRRWLQENVLPYLNDEKLYPAFGAVLRILETIKDPNEGNYFGERGPGHQLSKVLFTKNQDLGKFTKPRVKPGSDEVFEDTNYEYMKQYINWAIIGIGSFVFLLVLLFFFCRNKRNREKLEKKQSAIKQVISSDDSRKLTMKQRMQKVFTRSQQYPSADESGFNKRSDSDELFRPKSSRSVTWEHEKQPKKISTGTFKKNSSDFLPRSDSDTDGEEVILSKISLNGSHQKMGSKTNVKAPKFSANSRDLYRISEDSEGSTKSHSKSTLKSSSTSQLTDPPKTSTGLLNKLRKRSKSPKKDGKNKK